MRWTKTTWEMRHGKVAGWRREGRGREGRWGTGPIRAKANGWNITLTCTVFNFRLVSIHHRTHLPKPYTVFSSSSLVVSPLTRVAFILSHFLRFSISFVRRANSYIVCECKHPLSSMRFHEPTIRIELAEALAPVSVWPLSFPRHK